MAYNLELMSSDGDQPSLGALTLDCHQWYPVAAHQLQAPRPPGWDVDVIVPLSQASDQVFLDCFDVLALDLVVFTTTPDQKNLSQYGNFDVMILRPNPISPL